ncbi:MAG: tetratricopeptide repeat protein [Verrucomicrobiota bacterium]|jgi:tetratricopeptide (TPR) repeat protein|nr:tetratricopeptide repeat protein [Verrucomicrobiota bacterium]
MAASPPSSESPQPAATETIRRAANRRIAGFVGLFCLLLIGAVFLVMRKDQRRTVVIQPEPTSAAMPSADEKAEARPERASERPADAPPRPASPILRQSEGLEQALSLYREASNYFVEKRFDLAEERAGRALQLYPNMAAAQRMLGLIYLQQGRIAPAIAVMEASLRNEPFDPEALSNLAFAYMQAKNMGMALELIETTRRLHPDYKPAIIQHGLMLLTQPEAAGAIETLREAVEAFPTLPGPRNNLAVALARAGDREGALEQFHTILRMNPESFSALFNIGALHAQETNAPAAIPWLRQAMALLPSSQFRRYLNDTDLNPIRQSAEFLQFLKELDPDLPFAPPPRR